MGQDEAEQTGTVKTVPVFLCAFPRPRSGSPARGHGRERGSCQSLSADLLSDGVSFFSLVDFFPGVAVGDEARLSVT